MNCRQKKGLVAAKPDFKTFTYCAMNTTTSHIKDQLSEYAKNPYSAVAPCKINVVERQQLIDRITNLVKTVCNGEPAVRGVWLVGKMRVSVAGCLPHHNIASEHGWYRLRLPGADGIVRLNDSNSPAVNISPSGAILWTIRDTLTPQRLTFEQLFARCEKLAAEVLA